MKTFTIRDMDEDGLSALIVDMVHRTAVHHTLWFREVEHQLGFEKALEVMDATWEKTRKIFVRRLSEVISFREHDGIPDFIDRLPREKKLSLLDAVAKNWLAQDGIWFQSVEFAYGMNDAKRCNDSTWTRFSPFEAHCVKKLLHLGEHPGLEGLEQALGFRMYSRINIQSSHWENGALIFQMDDCRVQSARRRKNLPDYPCRSAGLVEYARFASAIDSRIRTECLSCPPEVSSPYSFCAWKFTLDE